MTHVPKTGAGFRSRKSAPVFDPVCLQPKRGIIYAHKVNIYPVMVVLIQVNYIIQVCLKINKTADYSDRNRSNKQYWTFSSTESSILV